jgi:dTDP-4-amino-4,6-dideoxygalactose transaminase
MEPHKQPIIGGMFGIEIAQIGKGSFPHFLEPEVILLANARSGIRLLIGILSPHRVWTPSYLCAAMVEAIDQNLTSVRFYAVDRDLRVPSLTWLGQVQPNDLVILLDYFGFRYHASLIPLIKERGAWVLEDACQALLSADVGKGADFVLFSPRKFMGVPDGGILRLNTRLDLRAVALSSPPSTWWLQAFCASMLRGEFDRHGGERTWFRLFQKAEAACPVGYYAMSEMSRMLLEDSFHYSTIIQKRIENYTVLNVNLRSWAVFSDLPEGIVPLGFPLRVANRDRVLQGLFAQNIYPPVHWPLSGVVPSEFEESHALSAEIMTLPCDQRYNVADMERVVQAFMLGVRA